MTSDRVEELLHGKRSDWDGIKSILVIKENGKYDAESGVYGLHSLVKVKVAV
jgi:hypothetical protein